MMLSDGSSISRQNTLESQDDGVIVAHRMIMSRGDYAVADHYHIVSQY